MPFNMKTSSHSSSSVGKLSPFEMINQSKKDSGEKPLVLDSGSKPMPKNQFASFYSATLNKESNLMVRKPVSPSEDDFLDDTALAFTSPVLQNQVPPTIANTHLPLSNQ